MSRRARSSGSISALWVSTIQLTLRMVALDAGELFSFGYNVKAQPYVNYTVIDAKGEITIDVPIHLPRCVFARIDSEQH